MRNKKKSFYFKDYNETELIDHTKKLNIIKISTNKITFLFFIFFSLLLIFSIKITYISLSKDKKIIVKNSEKILDKKNRRDIIDRNGSVLAKDVILYDVGVRPNLLNDEEKKNLLIKLTLQFPKKNLNEIKTKLNKENFFSIGKRLTA